MYRYAVDHLTNLLALGVLKKGYKTAERHTDTKLWKEIDIGGRCLYRNRDDDRSIDMLTM